MKNPNPEIRNPKEARNPNGIPVAVHVVWAGDAALRLSIFGFLSVFGVRFSGFSAS
jgi:hypothetical protein